MKIESCDIILVKGNDLISKAIRKSTNSQYSHVALALDDFHVIETDWKYPVSMRHIKYRTKDYDVYRIENLYDIQKQRIIKYVLEYINTKYDYIQVFSHLLHILFDFRVANSNTRFICSELIDLAFNETGIDLVKDKPLGIVTPADISKSDKLIKVS